MNDEWEEALSKNDHYTFHDFLIFVKIGLDVEFTCRGEQYCACSSGNEEEGRYIFYRFYDDSSVQHFKSVELLGENAVIKGEKPKDMWDEVTIDSM
ncbi:hypothetical protein [Marininema halotolerans]|uniref:Uncharacterized protein n=1 Tax=Marininema halotolerans TaxID=1155944 RepID=A0A1I6UN45_9BACL|nr:hypothetical protein [Marininema halotolerans]SFT02818.1 hypothetical protein SAMN05444972_11840 [Marininema halotolerans]